MTDSQDHGHERGASAPPPARRARPWPSIALSALAVAAGLTLAGLATAPELRLAGVLLGGLGLAGLAAGRLRGYARERRLDRRLRRLQELTLASNDWHWEMDADLRFTYMSPKFEEIIGFPRERMLGQRRDALFDDKNDPAAVAAHLADLEARRPFRDFVYHHTSARNRDVWVRTSGLPVYDESGAFAGYRGTSSDITARRRAEQEAARTQARLRELTDNVPGAVYQFVREADGHMAFTFVSAGIADLYGVPPEKVRDDPASVFALVHPDDLERVRESIHEAYRRAGPWFCEYRIVVDGRVKWVRGQSQPQRDTDAARPGRVVWNGLLTDVTDVKLQQRELVRARERAETANKSKAEFLASMSHELRTPLNAVIGFSEVLENELLGKLGNPRYQAYATDIRESGEHLLDLINDILDHAKIEAGRRELHEEWLVIPDVVRATLRLVKERAATRGVELEVDLPDALPRLNADQRALKQILINLIGNAVKFTDEGGRVTISAERVDDALVLVVADTGIGIAEEDLQRVMAPFAQADNPMTREHEGTGLGLALVRQLTELHGGWMRLDSEPGVGTTVRVHLPADRLEDPAEARRRESGRQQQSAAG